MKSVYTIVLKPYEDEYLVRVPDVPGCVTGGKTPEEAVRMARDAISGCLCVYEDEGMEMPPSRMPGEVELEPGEFASLVDVDTKKYRAETDDRAVRKNVSLPAWMVAQADAAGVSLSQVLQEALRERLA